MRSIIQFLILLILLPGCSANPDTERKRELEHLFNDSRFKELAWQEESWQIQTANPETVEVNDGRGKDVNMSQLIDSLYYVKLETTPDNLIGHIDKLYQSADKIVIVDKKLAKEVFVFNDKGKFQAKVSQIGPGPQEYNELSDVSVDFKKEEIGILDCSKLKLLIFDFSGKFVKACALPMYVYFIEYLANGDIVLANFNTLNSHTPTIENFSLFLTDTSMSIRKKGFVFKAARGISEPVFSFWNIKQIYRNDNNTYFNPRLSNFIFKIDTMSVNAVYYLNMQGRGFSDNEMESMTDKIYRRRTDENDFFLFNGDYAINGNGFYCKVYNKRETFGCIYNNKTKQTTCFSSIITDRPDAILFNFPYTGFKNFFISPLSAPKIVETKNNLRALKKSRELINLYNSVQVNDNPILMYYSLR